MFSWDAEPLSTRLAWDSFTLGRFVTQGARAVYVLTAMPGNIGDHLIVRGTEAFLGQHGIAAHPVPASQVSHHTGGGRLLVPGSGALTRDWHEWLPDLVVTAAERFDDVVVLPSEIHPDVPEVARMLDLSNVVTLARDLHSYRATLPHGRTGFSLDLALYCPGFDPAFGGRVHPSGGTSLLSLRTDRSSALAATGLTAAPGNLDVSLEAADLDEFLALVRAADEVVTDRLHVLVAAVMSGVPVHYVDATHHKLARYVSFTFGPDAAHLLHPVDQDWLVRHGHARRTA